MSPQLFCLGLRFHCRSHSPGMIDQQEQRSEDLAMIWLLDVVCVIRCRLAECCCLPGLITWICLFSISLAAHLQYATDVLAELLFIHSSVVSSASTGPSISFHP